MSLRGNRGLMLWAVATSIALVQFLRIVAPATSLSTLTLLLAVCGAGIRPIALPGAARPAWLMERLGGAFVLAALGLAYDAVRTQVTGGAPSIGFDAATWAVLFGLAAAEPGAVARVVRLTGIEWTKLWRSRLFQVGLGSALAVTLLAGLLHDPLDGETGWSVAAQTLGTGLWAAEVFLLVLGTTTLAGELAQGTLKMILPHAYRRSEWIAAKGLVLALAATCFAAVVMLVSVIHAGATAGLGDVVKEGIAGFGEDAVAPTVFQSAAVMQDHFADAVLSGLGLLIATGLLGLCLSSRFDTVVPAISTAFLVFLGLKSADVLLGLSRDVLDAIYISYPPKLRAWTAQLGRGINETWEASALTLGLARAGLTSALALLFAIGWFSRRDLHG